MEAEFYFNDIFIGVVEDVNIQIALKGFMRQGPKAVVQFFCSKEVVEQWFITQTLTRNKFNIILLEVSNEKLYKVNFINPIMPMPIIDSEMWKFKIKIDGAEGSVKVESL